MSSFALGRYQKHTLTESLKEGKSGGSGGGRGRPKLTEYNFGHQETFFFLRCLYFSELYFF